MGVGTRLSNGCNVGALYSPMHSSPCPADLFNFLFGGGMLGNAIKNVFF
ncbi:MAG: hypothetical protein ACLU94_10955 [Catenibacillus sp.]